MRISDSAYFDLSKASLQIQREKLAQAQEHAQTGEKIRKPSDDPTAVALRRSEAAKEASTNSVGRTINVGMAALQLADAALSQVGDALQRARELAMQAASDLVNPGDRENMAKEITALRDQVLNLANTEAQGQYIFAGYKDDQPPFNGTGAYQGDNNEKKLEVAPGVHISTNVSGARVFGAGSGVDIFATLNSLTAALQANDKTQIRASLDSIDQANTQVTDSRADLGASMEALDVAKAVSDRRHDQAVEQQVSLVGIDAVDAFSELTRAQSALQAAVQIAAQIPPPGLVQRG